MDRGRLRGCFAANRYPLASLPHEDERNWHAHLLVTTRRFLDTGLGFEMKKARDLDPQVRGGRSSTYVKSNEEINIGKLWVAPLEVQNNIFKSHGLENRVDSIGINPQEHIGAVRMRSFLNQAVDRNTARHFAEEEHINSGARVLDKVTRHMSVFSRNDLVRAVKCVSDPLMAGKLVEDALADKSIMELFDESDKALSYYTTSDVREDELKLVRLSSYIAQITNSLLSGTLAAKENVGTLVAQAKDTLTEEQYSALSYLLQDKSGIRIMRGRAGSGKSHVLVKIAAISETLVASL